ncbi:type VI secretion system membrane subunit TssM [Methylobrevis albus]|uniref:Type VI secretion system membrane subunit TssM n=1 Tax=Methylobrevis albus TaxID=2793297 RepID=A0A931I1G3_9HYPH|nr:type VI secretion system membrane subunit TssM [Methylobrevis albus]MBH0237511.1 type VI secretion system membrane subunit TssM [Methylobrevis albus]
MTWLRILLTVISLIAFAVLVWFAGPLLAIGDAQPLLDPLIRIAVIAVVTLVVAVIALVKLLKKRKAAKALEKAIVEPPAEETDEPVLGERMRDAIATLKRSSGRRGSFLYDLPWYLVIGPPGAGKTTALVNSGLKFPLARGGAAQAVEGTGGTRYCDWWFTDEAVLIDTAGRYTTQDSDAKADRRSWLSFLDLLKTHRPRQPINGVIVAISLDDIVRGSPAEVNAHADAIRKRLAELHDELKVDFPVYALFTKADLVAGFMEYFADLDETKRRMVWGATFQTADKNANMVGEVGPEIDLLVERLAERLPERMQDEPDLRARAMLFGFPAQVGALKKPVSDFLARIFEPTRYQTNATLRGFYFTSGTQEGTPFDQVIGALARSYGVESYQGASFSGMAKSFFLGDLMQKVIFAEQGWVSTNVKAVRRNTLLRAAGFAAVALVSVGLLGAWWVSYQRNTALIDQTSRAMQTYRATAAPLIEQTEISDTDLQPVYERIHGLLHLPTGYAVREEPTPLPQTFGLSQRGRLQSAAEATYQAALERLFRPRLILRLERQMEANLGEPSFLYEALKVYLMLGGKAPMDRDLVVAWEARDWAENLYPGAPFADGRKALEGHLVAMLDLDTGEEPKLALNGPLVETAQQTLARLSVAERAYALLKSEARGAALADWTAARRGGPDVGLVFETTDGTELDQVAVPGFFTYAGFHEALLGRMGDIAESIESERYVLGAAGEQAAVDEQYKSLLPDVLALYSRDFISTWTAALGRLKLRPLVGDKPKYLLLNAAAAPTSPIRQLFESVRDETALTRERDTGEDEGDPNNPLSKAGKKAAQRLASKFGTAGRVGLDVALKSQQRAGQGPPLVPGADIEAYFKHFHVLVDGDLGARPIDSLISNLNEIYQSLTLAATNPVQAQQAVQALQVQVASLRANASRLPEPAAGMVRGVANDIEGDATGTSITQLGQLLADQITVTCQQITGNRYPFAPGSERDVPLNDFARLFAPNGVLDRFFFSNLAPLADTSKAEWTWKEDVRLARDLSDATLKQFQRATQIRDAFFPGGGNLPQVRFEVKPLTLSGEAEAAVLDVNGFNVVAQHGPNIAGNLQWPPASGSDRAAIYLVPELPNRRSVTERTGPWALFRLLDTGSVLKKGDAISASFVVGGREASFQFSTGSLLNPFSLPALRDFKCPSGL